MTEEKSILKKLLDYGEREELMEKLELLFSDADENMQRRAIYKLALENWDTINHNANTLHRIENMFAIINRVNIMKDDFIV